MCPSLVATSVILLHERFCTSEHNDPSMLKCLEAANSILQNMQVLNSTVSVSCLFFCPAQMLILPSLFHLVCTDASFHPRQIPPFLSFCWTVAARTYLRQMAIRQFKGMPPAYPPSSGHGHPAVGPGPTLEDEVRHLTQIVTSIVARLEHFRTPVGRESLRSPCMCAPDG